MTNPKPTTPRCNCGSPCSRCLKRCTCSVHWHHPDQEIARQEAKDYNRGKYKGSKKIFEERNQT